MEEEKKGIGLFGLIGLVVSSCIGSGVFALTGQIGQVAAPGSALVAWGVVGVGFLALALSFANLGAKRSDLHGIFSYAEEGFGKFSGFISGWGYWLSAWLGNVAFATILMSTLGFFLPYFLPGNNIGSIVVASVIMWGITFLVIRGVESAAFLNAIVMIAKVVPIVVFILFSIVLFNAGVFTADFWGQMASNAAAMAGEGVDLGGVGDQGVQNDGRLAAGVGDHHPLAGLDLLHGLRRGEEMLFVPGSPSHPNDLLLVLSCSVVCAVGVVALLYKQFLCQTKEKQKNSRNFREKSWFAPLRFRRSLGKLENQSSGQYHFLKNGEP